MNFNVLILNGLRPPPIEILRKEKYSPHGLHKMVQVLIVRSFKMLKDDLVEVNICKMSQKQYKKVKKVQKICK